MEYQKRNIKLFIVSGKARSGKGEVSNIIKNYYSDKKTIIISFGHYIKDYAKRITGWDGNEETKPRDFLQQLGIELIKNNIDSKLFINRILEDIEVFSYFYDIIVVNDARLLDEINSLKSKYKDSICIRVIRDNIDNKLTTDQKNHVTEVDLDNYDKFDYVVNNTVIIDDLKIKVENILKEV